MKEQGKEKCYYYFLFGLIIGIIITNVMTSMIAYLFVSKTLSYLDNINIDSVNFDINESVVVQEMYKLVNNTNKDINMDSEFNIWECKDGCLYAEWVIYGYKKLDKPSNIYLQCINVCENGEEVFTNGK